MEEKLAIIKEVKKNGRIVETCRKYSIDPGMYYRWKESYDSFGLDGLNPHYRRMEPGMRKIMKVNEKLKSLLADKELENALLSDALKKDGEETMNMANEYIDRGLRVSDVANLLQVPRCSFYRNDSSEGHSTRRGRKNSSFTMRNDGDTAVVADNRIIVNEIEVFLSKEFVCYGYKKKAKQLNRLGYIVNGEEGHETHE